MRAVQEVSVMRMEYDHPITDDELEELRTNVQHIVDVTDHGPFTKTVQNNHDAVNDLLDRVSER